MCRCQRRCYIYTTTLFAILAAIFVIAGSVLVAMNDKQIIFVEDLDDGMKIQFGVGIAMICIGIIFAIIAICTAGRLHWKCFEGTNCDQSFDNESGSMMSGNDVEEPPCHNGVHSESHFHHFHSHDEPSHMPDFTHNTCDQGADCSPCGGDS